MTYVVLMCLVALMGAMLWIPWLRKRVVGGTGEGIGWHYHALNLFVLLATAFWCVIAIRAGVRLDYEWYLLQWDVVIKGVESPWVEHVKNAYGPLYNLLAYVTLIDSFAPKLIFVFVWCWSTAFLVGRVLLRGGPAWCAWAVAVVMLATPFFPITIPHYGFFDILPAGLCLLAIHLRIKDRDAWAGAALAAAVLLKFYPIALLPFLMLDGRRLRIRIALWCMGIFILGMLSSYLYWGESTWRPLLFASERPSALLSIFAFLRGEYSPLGLFMENPNADFLSAPAMIVFGGAVWLFCWRKGVDLVPACIAGMATGLQLYKVGHKQFLMVLVLLIMYWAAIGGGSLRKHKPAVFAAAGSLLWWTTFSLIYAWFRRYMRPTFYSIQDPVSLITFAQTVWLVLAMLSCRQDKHQEVVADDS